MEQLRINVSPNWQEEADKRMLVEQGRYTVRLEALDHPQRDECPQTHKLKAQFRVCDGTAEDNRILFETFNLESYPEKFAEFLAAAGMNPEVHEFTDGDLVGKQVIVQVVHRRDDNGKFWANIAYYRPLEN
jgi:hypothetical protein